MSASRNVPRNERQKLPYKYTPFLVDKNGTVINLELDNIDRNCSLKINQPYLLNNIIHNIHTGCCNNNFLSLVDNMDAYKYLCDYSNNSKKNINK